MTSTDVTGRAPRVVKWIFLSIFLSPVFISIPGFRILPLRMLESAIPPPNMDNAVSLLALFIAALGIPLLPSLARAVSRRDPVCVAGLLLAAYFSALGAVGALRTSNPYPLLAAMQYVLPVAAVVIGYLFRTRHVVPWPSLLVVFIVLNLALPFLAFLDLYLFGDGMSAARGLSLTNRYFYALYSHLPALILLASVFLMGWLSKRGAVPIALVSGGGMATVYFTTWSRAAILTSLVALAVLIALVARELLSRPEPLLKTQLTTCAAMLVTGLVLPPLGMIGMRGATVVRTTEPPGEMVERLMPTQAPQEPSTNVDSVGGSASGAQGEGRPAVGAVVEEESPVVYTDLLDVSTETRFAYMQIGLQKWYESPLFGIMFVPEDVHVIHRTVVQKRQIFQSHNQYIDILLKSGVTGLLLFAGFYVWIVLRPLVSASLAATSSADKVPYYATLAILAGVAVGANFQLYVTVWTTGVPLGFVMGYMVANARPEPER